MSKIDKGTVTLRCSPSGRERRNTPILALLIENIRWAPTLTLPATGSAGPRPTAPRHQRLPPDRPIRPITACAAARHRCHSLQAARRPAHLANACEVDFMAVRLGKVVHGSCWPWIAILLRPLTPVRRWPVGKAIFAWQRFSKRQVLLQGFRRFTSWQKWVKSGSVSAQWRVTARIDNARACSAMWLQRANRISCRSPESVPLVT